MKTTVLTLAVVLSIALVTSEPVSMPMGRHDLRGITSQHRRLLQSTSMFGAHPNAEVYGDVYPVAIFWVYAAVGTPPQPFPVAIDTGSFTMDIPITGCTTCPQAPPNNFYDVSKSSTGSASCPGDQCSFSNSYQTCDLSSPSSVCTISGNYYQDQVSIGGLKSITGVFGGINFMTANFDQFKFICGVVGVAPSGGNQDIFGSLYAAGGLDANTFAMCFIQGSKSNGTFTLGGIDSRLYTSPIAYVPNANGFGGFNLGIQDFTIGGVSAGSNFQNSVAILDSGTNVLLVTDEQYAAIKQVFMNNCTANPLAGVCSGLVKNGTTLFDGTCYPLTEAQIDKFPDLQFIIPSATQSKSDPLPDEDDHTELTDGAGNLVLTMKPRDYLIYRFYENDKCLGILPTGSEFDGGLFIVGDTLMQSYYTVFDNTNGQIGWATVNQNTCGSI